MKKNGILTSTQLKYLATYMHTCREIAKKIDTEKERTNWGEPSETHKDPDSLFLMLTEKNKNPDTNMMMEEIEQWADICTEPLYQIILELYYELAKNK